jgi:hypothetical protein
VSSARWIRFTLHSSPYRGADHLDLDRTVARQPGDTDRGTRMPSVLAQHLDEEITGRIGDPRLLTELGRTGHEDQHLHDPDPVQISHRLRSDGERVERGLAREPPRRLHVDVPADDALAQQLTVLVRQLAHAGQHDGVYYAMGYSGHGVQMATYMGRQMAEYMSGVREANI